MQNIRYLLCMLILGSTQLGASWLKKTFRKVEHRAQKIDQTIKKGAETGEETVAALFASKLVAHGRKDKLLKAAFLGNLDYVKKSVAQYKRGGDFGRINEATLSKSTYVAWSPYTTYHPKAYIQTGMNALMLAAANNHLSVVNHLIDNYYSKFKPKERIKQINKVNSNDTFEEFNKVAVNGYSPTAFDYALYYGHTNIIKSLFKSGGMSNFFSTKQHFNVKEMFVLCAASNNKLGVAHFLQGVKNGTFKEHWINDARVTHRLHNFIIKQYAAQAIVLAVFAAMAAYPIVVLSGAAIGTITALTAAPIIVENELAAVGISVLSAITLGAGIAGIGAGSVKYGPNLLSDVINATGSKTEFLRITKPGMNALMTAAAGGHDVIVKFLIDNYYAKPEHKDEINTQNPHDGHKTALDYVPKPVGLSKHQVGYDLTGQFNIFSKVRTLLKKHGAKTKDELKKEYKKNHSKKINYQPSA